MTAYSQQFNFFLNPKKCAGLGWILNIAVKFCCSVFAHFYLIKLNGKYPLVDPQLFFINVCTWFIYLCSVLPLNCSPTFFSLIIDRLKVIWNQWVKNNLNIKIKKIGRRIVQSAYCDSPTPPIDGLGLKRKIEEKFHNRCIIIKIILQKSAWTYKNRVEN